MPEGEIVPGGGFEDGFCLAAASREVFFIEICKEKSGKRFNFC
jgi:hypothetical protein